MRLSLDLFPVFFIVLFFFRQPDSDSASDTDSNSNDSDIDPQDPFAKLNVLMGREANCEYFHLIDAALANVKRFIGVTNSSFLFVDQRGGGDECLVKVAPFEWETVEEVYKEALCLR